MTYTSGRTRILSLMRVAHALEIIYESGQTYTSFRKGSAKERDFRILKFAIDMPREVLFERISTRVSAMIDSGLEPEIKNVEQLRGLNSLNTVGVKEMFDYFDGKLTLQEAKEKIARNTRVFAKKQLTWLNKDQDVTWCRDASEILSHIQNI